MSSLGNDLALIREQQSMSIDDVQRITKIPPPILQSIEDDSIFTQLDENITYIRSYVRSYAKAIHIDEQDISQALNEVEADMYEGSLFEGLDEDEAPSNDPDDAPSTDKETDEPTEKAESDQPKKDKRLYRPRAKREDTKYMLSSSDKLSSVDWADIGHKAHPTDSKSTNNRLIWGVVFLLIILLVIFLLYTYFNDEQQPAETPQNPTTTAVQPASPSDSLRQSLIGGNQRLSQADSNAFTPNGALSDTLLLSVYAAGGKLEPIRIYTDIMGIQNPYWIEQGDTMRFEFVNTIRLRATGQYEHVELLFNGHRIQDFYKKFYNEKIQMVELNRSLFEDNSKWHSLANSSRP